MRIKHIITKEGKPMANPEMEYPKPIDFYDFEIDDGDFQKADDDYNEALEKYHSGLLPFERQIEIRSKLPDDASAWDGIELRRDTLIPVDLEVEVINKQTTFERYQYGQGMVNAIEFTKVLRIKP